MVFGTHRGLTVSNLFPPRLIFVARLNIRDVLDLCDPQIQAHLKTSVDELVAPWAPYVDTAALAPTQQLGVTAFTSGRIRALRVPSAKDPKLWNLVVFNERLEPGKDLLEIVGEGGAG